MARALIVGCGCRGRTLAGRLLDEGWTVRGTSRSESGCEAIAAAGAEAARADPASPGSILELVGDVAVVYWLLASARGTPEEVAALHRGKLERLLEHLVDTPVRGFVYERAGTLPEAVLGEGEEAVRRAAGVWRLPVAVIDAPSAAASEWAGAMAEAAAGLVGGIVG